MRPVAIKTLLLWRRITSSMFVNFKRLFVRISRRSRKEYSADVTLLVNSAHKHMACPTAWRHITDSDRSSNCIERSFAILWAKNQFIRIRRILLLMNFHRSKGMNEFEAMTMIIYNTFHSNLLMYSTINFKRALMFSAIKNCKIFTWPTR